ncbi:hypothetical protein TBLA_0A04830 [Henningerozyma blattae CBS 6284]|uniref:PQ-loop repeat-containing protein 1 n=1 Tax=Henningerozyma blattae (strain ATCC 34711 / CBS 6284 / DSM 70876 / NBRC 10599 / NRRL Y-10934 / UCD 77-7) TaxID=1071380 RepID=I2GVX4_HENB6|nr:hypothetical protein TBLA_0A04830 [Tetrapisispora blattae CBS 6284]CCH58276.1 hypothetical protein TBLA_0A04830 [Tetrapisispora blattae CBS 6284]
MEDIHTTIQNTVPSATDTLASYLPRVDQFYIPEWFTMQFVANNLISFTPLFSYGTTIYSIEKSQTALGFSIDICATMLIASILRVSYYLITPYEISLLRQSLVMIFIQLILLRTSLRYRPEEYKYRNLITLEPLAETVHEIWFETFGSSRPPFFSSGWRSTVKNLSFKSFLDYISRVFIAIFYKILKFFDPSFKRIKSFWQWDEDKMFWKFLAYFATFQLLITFFVSHIMDWEELAQWIGSVIGSLGLLVESLLPLPQIAILYKLKSVQGFKLILLVSWLCGDTLKITYLVFGAKNISILFLFFAFFQMSLDFYIGGQYIFYKYYFEADELKEELETFELNAYVSRSPSTAQILDVERDSTCTADIPTPRPRTSSL